MKSNTKIANADSLLLQPSNTYLLITAFLVMAAGILVLLGWYLDVEILKQLLPGSKFVNPIASIGLVLSASSFLLISNYKQKVQLVFAAKALSVIIISIATLKLISHFGFLDFKIEEVLFPTPVQVAMPVNSAFVFLLIGLSLLYFNQRAFFSQFLLFIVALVALLSIVGYIHSIPELTIPFYNSFITIPIAICILMLSVTMLVAGRNKGYMAEILSNHSGGRIARKLFPIFLIIPLILEFLHQFAEPLKLYSSSGIVLLFCVMLGFFLLLGLNSVRLANKTDRKLEAEIDEPHKVEVEMKNSNLFLETIVENIPNMIFVKKGKELRFAAINKAGEALLGISRQECIGKTDEDIFPKEQAEAFKQKDLEVFKNDKVVLIEEEPIFTKDGQRWLRTKKIPIKDNHGVPLYIVGISEDITEKKAQDDKIKQFYAELEYKVNERTEELLNSEKRFRALIENSTDCITIVNSSSKIAYESPAVERITGYSLRERKGSLLFKIVHPEDIDICNEIYKEVINNPGVPTFIQYRLLHKNGKYIWIEGTATNLLHDESVEATVFNYRDVTERIEHEHERELLIQELTKHNQDLRQFSYITSHNLRAPLSNLLGLLELIKDTPIKNQALKEIVGGFEVSTNSLNDTINDLLRVLYIKENTAIDQEEILVIELFDKIRGQVSNLISEIEPEIIIDIEQGSSINFNKAYLESIFLNLFTNAIKYRSPKRKLKLVIKMDESKQESVVTFEDNGIGLDVEKHKEKLFGLYQRFHDHPDSKGLGLYLVKTQVEALGGKIEIESTVGIGTKFTLTFNKLYAEQSFFH